MSRQIELLINEYPIQINLSPERTQPKVACLGPAGTYTEEARHKLLGQYLPEMRADFLRYNAEVVQKVQAQEYDLGIVPVENSTEGDVAEVLRELNHAGHVRILGETILGIEHVWIGWPGESVEQIGSHPQALGQSRTFILNLLKSYPNVEVKEYSSTAAAVEPVRDNKKITAIANKRAAEVNRLPILAENIGDMKDNSTRFLMIGRGETNPTGEDSTALIFTAKDQRGILARCLDKLDSYGINLTKIDSRPTGIMREYAFWVTIDGHQKDEKVSRALVDLRKSYCTRMRILGSYRKAPIPAGLKDPGALNGYREIINRPD